MQKNLLGVTDFISEKKHVARYPDLEKLVQEAQDGL